MQEQARQARSQRCDGAAPRAEAQPDRIWGWGKEATGMEVGEELSKEAWDKSFI